MNSSSQPAAAVPYGNEADPYDITYFPRDTRRIPTELNLIGGGPKSMRFREVPKELGSPGNKVFFIFI